MFSMNESNDGFNIQTPTLNAVKEQFRRRENVIAIWKGYDFIADKLNTRILALVESSNTFGLFAFAIAKNPPEYFSDLTIDSVYPLNDNFSIRLCDDPVVAFGNRVYEIISNNIKTIYHLSTHRSPGFEIFGDFYEAISTAVSSTTAAAASAAAAVATGDDDPSTLALTPSFEWLEVYKREDQSAIDRSIADGTVTLKKRESKFREELERHEFEYIVHKDFRIYTATWNVNGRPCADISLNAWLANSDEAPDIYAISFQELDLSPKAITFSESRPDPIWIKKVMDCLHPDAVYEELVSVRLVGMMLIVAIRQELRKNVIRYSTQTVGTGALHFMGNKGGVGVSMQINEAFICFVNSHFAAHLQEIDRRKEDHDEIIRRMQFEYGIQRRSIDEHNHIFWIGDLNYRLADSMPRQVFDTYDFSNILKSDQLYQEMQRRRVFQNYTEGPIKFRPTYRYDPGTDDWDSSEKLRAPAWCDRILWKGERIRQLQYSSVMSLQLSDHKPVYAIFMAGVKTKDEQKYKRVHEEVLKRVDKYENDNQPQITVEETDIDFDVIQFNETYIRDFTVANNCHLPVHFEFSGKDGIGSKICEPWLHVEPTQGELITGDTLSIRIKVFIDVHTAWRIHRKQKVSNRKIPLDILVLHVDKGRDIFITIMGEYRPSCFGFSIDTLAKIPHPVYEMDLKDLMKIEKGPDSGHGEGRENLPREIYFLVDYLYKNGLKTPQLFTVDRKYKSNPNINDIRDWLNIWATTDFPGTPHTAAEALLILIESAPEALVSPLEDECLYAESFDKCCELILILSRLKRNAFLYICIFLQELLKSSQHNRLDAAKLATIFGRVFLYGHGSASKSYYRTMSEKDRDDRRTLFMMKFLCNDIERFAKEHLM